MINNSNFVKLVKLKNQSSVKKRNYKFSLEKNIAEHYFYFLLITLVVLLLTNFGM